MKIFALQSLLPFESLCHSLANTFAHFLPPSHDIPAGHHASCLLSLHMLFPTYLHQQCSRPFDTLCVCMCVCENAQACTCPFVYVSACVVGVHRWVLCGGQRKTSGAVPQELSTLFVCLVLRRALSLAQSCVAH